MHLVDSMSDLMVVLMAFLIIVTLAILSTDTSIIKTCHLIDNRTSRL